VQELSLGSLPCRKLGVALHEFGHALGLWHEQSRVDRDDFIEIIWDNVKPRGRGSFSTYLQQSFSVPYDYGSIMHYSAYVSNPLSYIIITCYYYMHMGKPQCYLYQ